MRAISRSAEPSPTQALREAAAEPIEMGQFNLFPPTDFHSATCVGGHIYIIGRLGYYGSRGHGATPVYRLSCDDWSIEPVATSGESPGWIYEHKTRLTGPGLLAVSGGTILQWSDGEEEYVDNDQQFLLNLATMSWSRQSL